MSPFRLLGVVALLLGSQQPVFRSGVELVTVDATVLNRSGEPIADLAADRFDVTVDGSPRRVVSAQFVPHRTAPLAASAPVDHFTSNEGVDPGRLILVAVDQTHIRRVEGLAALRAAANFIDALDPSDEVAVTPVNHGGALQITLRGRVRGRELRPGCL
jgi:hypothetical protein